MVSSSIIALIVSSSHPASSSPCPWPRRMRGTRENRGIMTCRVRAKEFALHTVVTNCFTYILAYLSCVQRILQIFQFDSVVHLPNSVSEIREFQVFGHEHVKFSGKGPFPLIFSRLPRNPRTRGVHRNGALHHCGLFQGHPPTRNDAERHQLSSV